MKREHSPDHSCSAKFPLRTLSEGKLGREAAMQFVPIRFVQFSKQQPILAYSAASMAP